MTYHELLNLYKKYVGDDIELEGIEYIIQETIHLSRSELILNYDKEVPQIEFLRKRLDDYCIHHIPSQYVIGYAYFYGYKFKVTKDVLIPRFDTEILVEEVIQYIVKKNASLRIVDIGTGSGAIAIAIRMNVNCFMEAVDISSAALKIAKENAKNNDCDISFIESDLLKNTKGQYDIIVSNPPYIDEMNEAEGVQKIVHDNEPHLALYSKDKGLSHYKRIIEESREKLKEDGVIFFEIPDNKCDQIVAYAKQYYQSIQMIEDYHHLRRVLKIGDKIK